LKLQKPEPDYCLIPDSWDQYILKKYIKEAEKKYFEKQKNIAGLTSGKVIGLISRLSGVQFSPLLTTPSVETGLRIETD
jgi:hypothetical protein